MEIIINLRSKKEVEMDKVEAERESIRRKQTWDVMPLIGNLLDAWDDLPNDVKTDPELERLADKIESIDRAMENTDA